MSERSPRFAPSVVRVRVATGGGTGWVATKDGLVVTNHHVVDYDQDVVLRTHDGRDSKGRVVRVDARKDVAIVAPLTPLGVPPLALGDARRLTPGDPVIAIGHPHGLEYTITSGVVSALRKVRGVDHVQTDAALNPGNSGGPLLDDSGAVIAMNTFGRRDGESLGFAVAIHEIQPLIASTQADPTRGPSYTCHVCEQVLDLSSERCRGCGTRRRFHDWDDLSSPEVVVADRAAVAIVEELGFAPSVCRTGQQSFRLETGAGQLSVRIIGKSPYHVAMSVVVARTPERPSTAFLRFLATANDRSVGAVRIALEGDLVTAALVEPVEMLDVRTLRPAVEDMLRLSHRLRRVLATSFGARPPPSADEENSFDPG
ncbi:MAG: trypsin-like serine protease [Polyangiaceae bacterium]|nr:trypsin-like serine protease [Polyangiaceae bacterium]